MSLPFTDCTRADTLALELAPVGPLDFENSARNQGSQSTMGEGMETSETSRKDDDQVVYFLRTTL
jgi:hypothetical protein